MKSFLQLKKNLKKDYSGLKQMKIALLADTASQFLVQALRGLGYDSGYDLDIWEADFNQMERQCLDPSSEIFDFKPRVVIIFQSTPTLEEPTFLFRKALSFDDAFLFHI